MFRALSRTSIIVVASALAAFGSPGDAHTRAFQVLYSFSGGNDGAQPLGALVADQDGNLYGTTVDGGAFNHGTIFKLAPDGTETVLHSFMGGSDGDSPVAGLIRDAAGNLFGTTSGADGGSLGTVFKLAPDDTLTTLYQFKGFPDGAFPVGGVVEDQAGNLYGTTREGGFDRCSASGCGTVFKVAQDGTETVLYTFCARTNCKDGIYPYAGVTFGSDGALYGTTFQGGDGCQEFEGCGTVFRLGVNGHEKVLHAFGSGSDGSLPNAGVTFDGSGNLYGTTASGGSNPSCGACGVVFKIAADGTESVIYSFDGSGNGLPVAGLTLDAVGNLYGTRKGGGLCDACGTAFEIAPDGTATILHEFCQRRKCVDGQGPFGGLIAGGDGNFYGTTDAGGAQGLGSVFRLRN
jgi:uncharacterized repeat protein (TIGR03803 family)